MRGKEFTDKVEKKLRRKLHEQVFWKRAVRKRIETRVPISKDGRKTDIDISLKMELPAVLNQNSNKSLFVAIEVKHHKRKGYIKIEKHNGYTVKKVKEFQRARRMASVKFHPIARNDFTRQLRCYADQNPDLIALITNMHIEPRYSFTFPIRGHTCSEVPCLAIQSCNLDALLERIKEELDAKGWGQKEERKDLPMHSVVSAG